MCLKEQISNTQINDNTSPFYISDVASTIAITIIGDGSHNSGITGNQIFTIASSDEGKYIRAVISYTR